MLSAELAELIAQLAYIVLLLGVPKWPPAL